jgi:hypothetical protein
MLRGTFQAHAGTITRATRCLGGIRSIVREMTMFRVLGNAVLADMFLEAAYAPP